MSKSLEVFFANQQDFLPISQHSVEEVVKCVLKEEKKEFDEVSVFFVSTEGMCSLHAQYFNDPSPTDCISFPMDSESEEGYRILGDVFVCPETANSFLEQAGSPFSKEDIYKETTLYLVHGLLHLLGYDDIEEQDRLKMRIAEKRLMDKLQEQSIFLSV